MASTSFMQLEGKNLTEKTDALYKNFQQALILKRFYTLGLAILSKEYSRTESMAAIADWAGFDRGHDDPLVAKAATNFILRHESHLGKARLRECLEQHSIAAMRNDNLIYLINKCVKTDSKAWQITTFILHDGPIGDCQLDTIDEILEHEGFGAYAKYVEYEDLEPLLDECITKPQPPCSIETPVVSNGLRQEK